MRFAIHTLVFYGLDTLKLMVENTGAYVDKIYLSHSAIPWSAYNAGARGQYRSEVDKSMVESLPFKEKIVWLEGVWSSEEDQRNHSLEQARVDGMDYMIIQDSDEFYIPESFLANLSGIEANPNYPVYRCPWTVFWKSLNYVIQVREHEGERGVTVTTCPNFAVNVRMHDVKFVSRRLVNRMDQTYTLSGLCLHLAWILSDEEVLQKIQTWGHSHQFDYKKWYQQKWLAWQPGTRYIGHITRANYLMAVPFIGSLPRELNNFPVKKQVVRPLTLIEEFDSLVKDYYSLFVVKSNMLKNKLVQIFRQSK
jgi:hypothetical protein